jgi:hypothetical protein
MTRIECGKADLTKHFLFIQAEGHIIECLHGTKMVFKVLEAEHLQGRQIEQKVDSTLFLVDYSLFHHCEKKTIYLFYWGFFFVLICFSLLFQTARWKSRGIRHERYTRLA